MFICSNQRIVDLGKLVMTMVLKAAFHYIVIVSIPCALSGCIVAAEKPSFDTSIIVGKTEQQQEDYSNNPASTPKVSGAAAPKWPTSTVIIPPRTCLDLPADDKLAMYADAKERRNSCVANTKSKIHEAYIEYRRQIARNVGLTDEGLDVASGTFSAAATATSGLAKQVLTGINSALTTGHAAFDNDALFKQSLTAIFKQMDADVDQQGAEMDVSTQQEYAGYPMYRARFDLLQYYNAGTIQHALDNLDAAAGTAKSDCAAAQKMVTAAVNKNATIDSAPAADPGQDQNPSTSTSEQCKKIAKNASVALSANYKFGRNAKLLLDKLYPSGVYPVGSLNVTNYNNMQACIKDLNYGDDPLMFTYGPSDITLKEASPSSAETLKSEILICLNAKGAK